MIALIPCSKRPRQDLIDLIKVLYPDGIIILSIDEKANIEGVIVDKIIRHTNSTFPPPKNIHHYYNNILSPFIFELGGFNDEEPILLLHENVIINETSQRLLHDTSAYVFSSAKKRVSRGAITLTDNSDRCVAFSKQNFILCHTFENFINSFAGKTTLDFICEHLTKDQYIYHGDEVFIKELDSLW